MRMNEEARELKDRISQLSDEELLNMIEVDSADYRKEAIDYAKAELMRRGIDFDNSSVKSEQESDTKEHSALTCPHCGGEVRSGILFADRELTMVFSDSDEERFVNVYACGQCGQVQMLVDYDTDVQH